MTERAFHPKTNLWKAVLAFQADTPSLQKDKLNPAFRSKYLSLDALMEQVLPKLNEHGLVWLTAPNYILVNNGPETKALEPNLSYRLIHAESGEETGGSVPLLLDKQNAQGLGSAITYARRYALMAVLGLVADEDDDGNKASQQQRRPAKAANGNGKPAGLMSTADRRKLLAHVDEHDGNVDLLLGAVGAESTDDLTVEQGRQMWQLVTGS